VTIMTPVQALTAMQAGAAIEPLPRLVTTIADLVHIHGLSPPMSPTGWRCHWSRWLIIWRPPAMPGRGWLTH